MYFKEKMVTNIGPCYHGFQGVIHELQGETTIYNQKSPSKLTQDRQRLPYGKAPKKGLLKLLKTQKWWQYTAYHGALKLSPYEAIYPQKPPSIAPPRFKTWIPLLMQEFPFSRLT